MFSKRDKSKSGIGQRFIARFTRGRHEYKLIPGTEFYIDKTLASKQYERLKSLLNAPDIPTPQDALLAYFSTILQELDTYIALYAAHATCQKGCSHCCNMIADIFPLEYQNILHYIRTKLSHSTQQTIANNIRKRKAQYPQFFEQNSDLQAIEQAAFQMPCLFLNPQNGACLIYPVRPVVCRTYLAYTPPQQCLDDTHAIKHSFKLLRAHMLLFLEEHSRADKSRSLHFDALPHWFSSFHP